jgi:hypothetical protein
VPAIAVFWPESHRDISRHLHKIARAEKKEISYEAHYSSFGFFWNCSFSTFILAANGSIETNADIDIPAWYETSGRNLHKRYRKAVWFTGKDITPIPFLYLPTKTVPASIEYVLPVPNRRRPEFLEGEDIGMK